MKFFLALTDLYKGIGGGQTVYRKIIDSSPDIDFYYSSGMQMRLSLGVATAVQPDILLMDEWVMAGDAAFMEKARTRMTSFVEQARILVLASHSEAIIRQWCNKALLLKGGHAVAFGGVDEVFKEYGAG